MKGQKGIKSVRYLLTESKKINEIHWQLLSQNKVIQITGVDFHSLKNLSYFHSFFQFIFS